MLAGEQYRQQDPGNLVVAQSAAILVTGVHERLHEIVGPGPGKPAGRHDPAKEFGHSSPGPVTASMRWDRKSGEKKSQGVDAFLQVVVRLGKTRVHLIPDFLSNEATTGDIDGELVHRGRQIDFPILAESVNEQARLLEHDAGKPAHCGFAESRKQKPELLVHELGGGVVSHAAAEDGHRELIDGFGVQLIIGRAEVQVVGFGSGEENKLAGTESEPDEFAVLAPATAQHRDRLLLKIQQMTDQRPPTRELGNGLCRW